MPNEVVFLILGLGMGGAYAMMALGVVGIYRATGVPNFAQGSIAMLSAFVFFNLRDDVGGAPAAVLTIAFAAVLGVAFYFLVMRQLRDSPLMAKVAATVGLLLILHGIAYVAFPVASTTPPSILPQDRIDIGGYGIPLDRLLVAVIAVVIAAILEVVARRTRFGLATRAIAESEKGVILIGRSPGRLAAANWAIASVLGALAGILISPISGLNIDALTLLIVPVFAAALLARFTSYTRAVAAALALGMVQSLLQLYSEPGPWYTFLFQGPGRADAFPALVVFVVMLFSGNVIPRRDSVLRGRLPASFEPRHLRIGLPAILLVGTLLFLQLPINWVSALTATVAVTIVAASLVLLTGIGGQISLMQFAFAGLGGFIAAKAAASGWDFLPGVVAATAGGAALGLVVGIPALRIRGQALAIMTLAISLALYDLVFINGQLMGELGFLNVGGFPELAGLQFDHRTYGILCLVVAVGVLLAVALLRRSRFGLKSLLIRESERSAIIIGISVTRQKLALFVASAGIAALGGALLVHGHLVFSHDSYAVIESLVIFMLVYISGIGMISGAVIAGFGADAGVFSNILASFDATRYHGIIAGGLLLIALQLHPDGIATLPDIFKRLFRKRKARGDGDGPQRPSADVDWAPATQGPAEAGIQSGGER